MIVEGPSDRGFVKALLGKLGGRVEARVAVMNGYRPDKAARIVEAYHHKIDLAIVLLDKHCNPEERIAGMAEAIRGRVSEEARRKLRIIPVSRAIEAWALADPDALRSICGEARFTGNPEELHDPAKELRRELARCGKLYVKTPEWGRVLGEKVDPQRASRASRSLREFLEALEDP